MRRRFCHRHHAEGEPCDCRPGRLSRLIEPVVLLVVKQHPSIHGYEIVRRVRDYGLASSTIEPGAVYRVLRELEREGAVRSQWEFAGAGVPRRGYVLTEEGEALLEDWGRVILQWRDEMEQFVKAYQATKEVAR